MKLENQERIEAYLQDRLSTKEKAAFEADVKADPALLEALNLFKLEQQAMKLSAQDELRAQFKEWKKEKESGAKIIKPQFQRRRRFTTLSVAASVILIVGFGFAFWQGSQRSNMTLAEEGFVSSNRADRNNISPDSPLLIVWDTLEAGDTEAALAILARLKETPFKESALLLEGELYYQQEDWAKANTAFQELIDTRGNITNVQKAEWNYANSLLASGDTDAAKSLLQKMEAQEGHLYGQRAASLLKQLNSPWRLFSF